MKIISRFMPFVSAFLFLLTTLAASAQKLPDIQKGSLRAPVNIKTDGRATEWNHKFQAYNKNTSVFYTIANDDNKLYVTIQAAAPDIISKIIAGGITFTINGSGKMKDKDGEAITYPAYGKKEPSLFINTNSGKNTTAVDSFINISNKQLTGKLKTIGVAGIKTIKDNMLSIYNEEGIKAASLFDNKIQYTYELAVPLKYLDLSTDKQMKFSYNIKLNGASMGARNIELEETSHGKMIEFTGRDGVENTIGLATPENLALLYPTDFWGEYTLKKK